MNLQVLLSTVSLIERRSVTSDYHGSRISGSQQFFWTETAIGIVERWKKSIRRPFCFRVQSCNFFVFSAIFAGLLFVEIQRFCYDGNMT